MQNSGQRHRLFPCAQIGERPAEIASAFARRVEQEDKGWASEDELVASLQKNSKIAEPLQRNHAHFGTKLRDSDHRLIWKRDPNLVKGFIPTELWADVRKISCPTIYILGGASNIVPPQTQLQLGETLPHVKIVSMRGLGHYPHVEAPEEYLKIVDGFEEVTHVSHLIHYKYATRRLSSEGQRRHPDFPSRCSGSAWKSPVFATGR